MRKWMCDGWCDEGISEVLGVLAFMDCGFGEKCERARLLFLGLFFLPIGVFGQWFHLFSVAYIAYIAFEGFSLPIFEELHAQHTKHLQLHLDVQLWLYYSFTYLARMFHNQPQYSDSQICLNKALSHQLDRESRPNKPYLDRETR
jgi:hypothetical protein